jgi:hypothetical protein
VDSFTVSNYRCCRFNVFITIASTEILDKESAQGKGEKWGTCLSLPSGPGHDCVQRHRRRSGADREDVLMANFFVATLLRCQ